jgi:hypothetical protein
MPADSQLLRAWPRRQTLPSVNRQEHKRILFVCFSCFGFSFRFGELFHFTFFFLVLGLWPWLQVNPETQTVSHSFPKVSAALQRNFGTGAAYRAGHHAFAFIRHERIDTKTVLWILLLRRDAAREIGKWQISSAARIAPV